MELSDLKIFKAVIEEGGINAAALSLHRVPSNITARVKKLEAELSKALFIRERNRLRLSPAGEQLLVYAERILSLAEEAIEHLNDREPSGLLKIGTMEAVAASRMSPVLMAFHQRYPQVNLQLSTQATGELIEQILAGLIDLALVADPSKDERLDMTPIFEERLVLVSDSQHIPISQAAELGIQPLLLGFGAKCAYRNRLEGWVSQAALTPSVIEINSYHTLLNCAAAGMGVGLVPEVLLAQYPFKENIKVHKLPDKIQNTTTFLIWRKDSIKPSMRAFRAELLQYANIDNA